MPSKQDVLKLHLLKDKAHGLGIQISGGVDSKGVSNGIHISHLLDDGVASRDGRLRIGDEILFINGLSLISKTHKEATQLLQSTKNPVQLVITRQMIDDRAEDAPTSPVTNIFERNNNIMESKRVKKHTKEVILINGKDGKKLGFSIVGGVDDVSHPKISIKNIMQGGIIAEDGRLKTGDTILKVNDIPVSGFKHHEAISFFKSLKKGPVKFLIQPKRRPVSGSPSFTQPSSVSSESFSKTLEVVLVKAPGKGLGVGFGYSSKNGLLVKYIAKGSAAAKGGKLQLKDYIISLNGINMKDTKLEEFYKIIRNLQPGKVIFSIQRNSSDTPRSRSSSSGTSFSSNQSAGAHLSSNQLDGNNNRAHQSHMTSNLATLMSPAIPIRDKHTRTPGNKQEFAIPLNESDLSDDDCSLSPSPKLADNDAVLRDQLKHQKDGWLRRNSAKSYQEMSSNMNSDDEVVHFPGTGTDHMEMVEEAVEKDGIDQVTIEKDHSGSLGLSIKMKRQPNSGKHSGVFAKNVSPGGSADSARGSKDGGVRSGDEIVRVNGTMLDELSYDNVISFFRKIPKKSTFFLKRKATEKKIVETRTDTPSSAKSPTRVLNNSNFGCIAPNVIEDQTLSNQIVIQRNSVLTTSSNRKTHSSVTSKRTHSKPRSGSSSSGDSLIRDIPDKSLSSLMMNNRAQSPMTTMLSVSNHGVNRALTFKVIGKEQGIGVPLPGAGDIPDGMNVHLIEISKDEKESAGISLVPATDKCVGYFQVRKLQLGSVSEKTRQIFKDDCIYSVNGIPLNGITHPKALQILKQSGKNTKIILFRHKSKDDELLKQSIAETTSKPPKSSTPSTPTHRHDTLPGTTISEVKHKQVRPTLHRRTTDNSSLLSIPILNDHTLEPSSMVPSCVVEKNTQPHPSPHSLIVPSKSGDEESSDNSSNPPSPAILPNLHAINKRPSSGAFLIEYEKLFKGLGLEVMIDELGVCYVTEIVSHGIIGDDDRVRVGDNLVAINGEIVHGKPISVVRDMIRNIRRGKVKLILKVNKDDNSSGVHNETESVMSTSTTQADQHSHAGMSLFSLPLPNDVKSSVPTQRTSSFKKNIFDFASFQNDDRVESEPEFHHLDYRDDQSDVTVMPPAPPPPSLPNEFRRSIHSRNDDDDEEDSDLESIFSCIPGPPPPVQNFQIPTSHHKKLAGAIKLPMCNIEREFDENTMQDGGFDDEKSDFSILPPPPPRPTAIHSAITSNSLELDSQLQRMNKEFELHKRLSQEHINPELLQHASDPVKSSVEKAHAHPSMREDSRKLTTKSSSVENIFSRELSTDNENVIEKSDVSTVTTEVYYPPNSPYHLKQKKKSLFSRLKSKLILPSKNDVKQYESPQSNRNNKKTKMTKTKLSSSIDFKDTSSRTKLKSSISQPDLVVAVQEEKVEMRRNSMLKKAESLDEQSFNREFQLGTLSPSLLSTKALPRILSFRKPKSSEKGRKRATSTRSNVSPPSTPPPPPPSNPHANIYSETGMSTSHFLTIANKKEEDVSDESPYESIDNYQQFRSDGSDVSSGSSNSGGAGSYAAEGPSIHKETDVTRDSFSLSTDNNTKVIVNKPPTPPRNRSLQMKVASDDYGEVDEADGMEKPTLTKRGSSLLSLNFPPPPDGRYEEEKTSPLATSSVENSLELSEENNSDEINYDYAKLPLKLSPQDKNDPKLQPFGLTNEMLRSLSPRDVTNYDVFARKGDGDVGDDWGSEFSESMFDEPQMSSETQKLSRYASEHRSDMFTVSTATSPASNALSVELAEKKQSTSKRKDLKKNLFKRSTSQMEKEGKVLTKKERRKQIKSLPAALPDEKQLHISSPILMKRRTTSQIFSDKEINVIGGGLTNNPSLDDIVNETIRRNTNQEFDRSYAEKNSPIYSTREVSTPVKNTKNPIPKPPRRKSHSDMLNEEGEDYENLQHFQSWRQHGDDEYPVFQNETAVLRPVPQIPITEDEFRLNNSTLSENELNQLYASIDFTKKRADRDNSSNGHLSESVSTASSQLDKRNNEKPIPSPRKQRDKVVVNDENINSFREGSFNITLVRQAGKSLGIVLIGGRDTAMGKVLLKEVEPNSVASSCKMRLRPGDELIEVNNTNIEGYTHLEALDALKSSPPLVMLTLRRQLDGNESLLKKESAMKNNSREKINTAKFLASIKDSSKHTKESEIVQIKDSVTGNHNCRPEPPKPNLSVGTFDVEGKLNMILKTPPLLPKMRDKPAETRRRTQSATSLNTNVSVMSPIRMSKPVTPVKQPVSKDWLDIDLYKQPGKGLGIAVTGGPNHIIEEGIRVKRLVPDSIAGIDGRLTNDDLICTINGKLLKGMTQGDALTFLKEIPKVIHLGVRRGTTSNQTVDTSLLLSSSSPAPQQGHHNADGKSERKSRSKTKETSERRSRSEMRETRKHSEEKRPRSLSRLSRIFGGSRDNINTVDKESSGKPSPKVHTKQHKRNRSKSSQLLTLFFDKTEKDVFDFTLAGGVNTMYGDSSIVVDSVRKGSDISKSLKVRDELVSIQGVDVSKLSKTDAWVYLLGLPLGRVCMVIQRR